MNLNIEAYGDKTLAISAKYDVAYYIIPLINLEVMKWIQSIYIHKLKRAYRPKLEVLKFSIRCQYQLVVVWKCSYLNKVTNKFALGHSKAYYFNELYKYSSIKLKYKDSVYRKLLLEPVGRF